MTLVNQAFYRRDPAVVARGLLGKLLRREEVVLRITETEAYSGPEDSASHARFGHTPRNATMWGPPGRAYVYLCYGLHNMLNVVTGPAGVAGAVLIRAAEPVEGLSTISARRGQRSGPVLLTGPGKVGAALALDTSFSGQPLYRRGDLELRHGDPPASILTGPRVGIDFAEAGDRDAPRRFAAADSRWVSSPKTGLR